MFGMASAHFAGFQHFNLKRENRRHDALDGSSVSKVKIAPNKLRSNFVLSIVSVILITTLSVYFSTTGFVIGISSTQPSSTVSHVLIRETPVSWQYSPQVIQVVIGVNNTVVWTSHSFTYDTVTSSNGTFSSGLISPGSSFSVTFTTPGIYDYYCQFHLWMRGTVIVKNA